MAVALRSVRFLDEHAMLEVRECADRTQIQILVESGPPMAIERHVLTLTGDEWAQLTALPYLDRSDCERHEQPPDNVLEAFLLMDEHTSMEIRERPHRETVLVVVNGVDAPDENAVLIEVTADQWRYLCSLDYVRDEAAERSEPPSASDPTPPDTIH